MVNTVGVSYLLTSTFFVNVFLAEMELNFQCRTVPHRCGTSIFRPDKKSMITYIWLQLGSNNFDSPLRHHNKINGFGKYSIFSSPLFCLYKAPRKSTGFCAIKKGEFSFALFVHFAFLFFLFALLSA